MEVKAKTLKLSIHLQSLCHLCKEPLPPRRDLQSHAATIHDLRSGRWRPAGGLPHLEQTSEDPLPLLPTSVLGMGGLEEASPTQNGSPETHCSFQRPILGMGGLRASPAQNGPLKTCCHCSQTSCWAWEAPGPLTPRTEVRSNGSGSLEVCSWWGGLLASHTQNRGWEQQEKVSGGPFWAGDASSWSPTPRMKIGSSSSGSLEVCSGWGKVLSNI